MPTIKHTIEDNMIITNPTAFYIYDKKGRVRKDIKRAFLKSQVITWMSLDLGYMMEDDGPNWAIKCSLKTYQTIVASPYGCQCIVSYQELKDGNRIAIVRLLKDA